jgi:hypothetical protein
MFQETMRLEPESSFGDALSAWAHWWSVDQGLSENIAFSLERAIELARKAEDLEDFTGLSHHLQFVSLLFTLLFFKKPLPMLSAAAADMKKRSNRPKKSSRAIRITWLLF